MKVFVNGKRLSYWRYSIDVQGTSITLYRTWWRQKWHAFRRRIGRPIGEHVVIIYETDRGLINRIDYASVHGSDEREAFALSPHANADEIGRAQHA